MLSTAFASGLRGASLFPAQGCPPLPSLAVRSLAPDTALPTQLNKMTPPQGLLLERRAENGEACCLPASRCLW